MSLFKLPTAVSFRFYLHYNEYVPICNSIHDPFVMRYILKNIHDDEFDGSVDIIESVVSSRYISVMMKRNWAVNSLSIHKILSCCRNVRTP